MAKYIDKEKVLQKLSRMIDYCKNDSKVNGLTALFQAADAIIDCPTVEVEEKKDCERCIHFDRHATEYPCNYCRNCYTDKFQSMPNYCPSCGARMDGKDGEEE